jgi:aldehyde:ferredoxin oxidoreductase
MDSNDNHFGYTGTILRINLINRSITRETPSESYYRHYLGGRGIVMHTLLSEVPAHANPLGPENRLIFAAGLLTGHKLIGTAKCSVGAKSPLGGTCGEAEAGGSWGPELKKAGYDGIIFEGISESPVYLKIHNDNVELRDAGAFWGQEVRQAMEGMVADAGGGKWSSAVIGPGGERQVSYANIIVDCNRAFGRGGMGAVMGSKRLKGFAADDEKIVALNRLMAGKYKNSPFHQHGTGGNMKKFAESGNLPIRNHTGGEFPNVGKIDAVTLLSEYGEGMEGCGNCPIKCKKKIKSEVGTLRVDPSYGGAEYETLASFGSNLLIDDLPAICKAHEMCNRYGIDTMSMGSSIAFAMECFENGILTLNDTDGIHLNFGNTNAMLKMAEKIARREGLGDLLAKGVKQAAYVIGKGSDKYAMHVKGLSIPYHDPR